MAIVFSDIYVHKPFFLLGFDGGTSWLPLFSVYMLGNNAHSVLTSSIRPLVEIGRDIKLQT